MYMSLVLRFLMCELFLWSTNEVGGLRVTVTELYGAIDKKAVMRCSFDPPTAKVAHIIWRKGTHPQGEVAYYYGAAASSHSGPGELFKNRIVRGDINKGYHEISIEKPKESDEGLYTCVILLEKSTASISGGGYLTLVVVPAKAPEIRDAHGNVLSNTECGGKNVPSKAMKKNISLVCHAFAAKPPSIITWNAENISLLREVNRTHLHARENVVQAAESWIETSPNSHCKRSVIVCTVYSVSPYIGRSRRRDICLYLTTDDSSCSFHTWHIWMICAVAVGASIILLSLLVILGIARLNCKLKKKIARTRYDPLPQNGNLHL